MKNINLLRHLRPKVNLPVRMTARSRNDWDPAKLYEYNPMDEHKEPEPEDIVKDIYDKNYYHFGFKGKQSDEHYDIDSFEQYRQWQHLYTTPNEPFLGFKLGSAVLKYLFFLMPVFTFFWFIKIFPINLRQTTGRSCIRRYNMRI